MQTHSYPTLLPDYTKVAFWNGMFVSLEVRIGLDYREEVHQSRFFGEVEQYDWLQNGFFANQGLH